MKKAGLLTFHAAHNYGSFLQAYALSRVVNQMDGVDCEIINFRTPRQRDQYTPLTKRKGAKYLLKNGYFLLHYSNRKRKFDRFESAIETYLPLSTREYVSDGELEKDLPRYDYYISGSDQIWNTKPNDADMAYFLPFVQSGSRIAYAPSFGQKGNIEHQEEIASYLRKYDFLSVRENYGRELIQKLIGKEVPVLPDPTILLDAQDWDSLIGERPVQEEYLFFYTLFATKEMMKTVKKLSKLLHLPVVVSNITNQHDMFCPMRKQTDAGPLEFLHLVKHAKAVITSSFHGTVFSILFEKPFLTYRGMEDNRISSLLEQTGLTGRSCCLADVSEKACSIYETEYSGVRPVLSAEREKGIRYLKTALEIPV